MRRLLVDQMAMYSAYHRDPRTRLTHCFGVPSIVFALLVPPALVRWVELPGYTLSLATAVAASVMIYWIWLERTIGMLTALAHLPILWLAQWVAELGTPLVWGVFGSFFVVGWILQLWGHAAFEGRKPAFTDNLAQVLIAPFFLIAELLFALGSKRPLHDAIEARYTKFVV